MLILGSPFAYQPGTMLSAIERLGLTSGLQICLDASDINSYSGAGQSWLDTSGNAYDFFRGTTSASQSTDPTFNGSAGAQSSSEYWSFDGGDFFTLNQSNPAWVNNIHKNNAAVTLAAWVYPGSLGADQGLGGTSSLSAVPSFNWLIQDDGRVGVNVLNETTITYEHDTTQTISAGAWSFVAMALDEAGNAGRAQVNSVAEAFSCTYGAPSSASAGNVLQVAAQGLSADGALRSGGRMAATMMWNAALSATQLSDLYNATKAKFGH